MRLEGSMRQRVVTRVLEPEEMREILEAAASRWKSAKEVLGVFESVGKEPKVVEAGVDYLDWTTPGIPKYTWWLALSSTGRGLIIQRRSVGDPDAPGTYHQQWNFQETSGMELGALSQALRRLEKLD